MDLYQISLIGSMLIGIALMVYGLYINRKSADRDSADYPGSADFSFVAASAEEVAKTSDELHEISNLIFEELESKHNELLGLYEIINKKKREFDKFGERKSVSRNTYEEVTPIIKEGVKTATFAVSTANIRKVRQLHQEGYAVDEIVETLGIGLNEVKLMLDLSKIR